MNNQRSPKEQLLFNFLLSFVAVWFIFQYFNPQKNTAVPPRKAPALQQAFAGIDPASGPKLTPSAANAEIAKMQANIKANSNDDLAQWSRLRQGLIEQFILQKMSAVEIPGSLFSRPWMGNIYDELISHHGTKDIDAQAIFQKGDMLWRQSPNTPSHDAATTLEMLLQKSRGDQVFNNLKIYTQTPESNASAPQFKTQTVVQTLGGPGNNDPNSVLHRVDTYYQTTNLYKAVDAVVQIFGSKPTYSYGLAILFFAVCTRLLMQPLTKKQYESMKGMQVIAPEMKKIQDKYKGKTDQQAQMTMVKEIQDLQRRHGVSPMLGCGLGLIQLPLFMFIISPAMRHYEAKMELAGASFLWIQNLARPDIVLLVLYGIMNFISFRISSLPATDEQQRQQQRMMMFMMPMMPFFLLHYPSAFPLYWMLFNVTSTILQFRMMKATDPEKSAIKSILGSPAPMFTPAETEKTDAVPPRPKDGVKNSAKKAKLTLSEGTDAFEKNGALNGTLNGNGHQNGSQNGKVSADESSIVGAAAENVIGNGAGKANSPKNPRRKRRY